MGVVFSRLLSSYLGVMASPGDPKKNWDNGQVLGELAVLFLFSFYVMGKNRAYLKSWLE